MSKDHFYFNRNDRTVALILLSVILVVNIVLNPWKKTVPEPYVETDSLSYVPDTFKRTIYIRDTVRRKWYIWDTVVITKTLSYTAKARPVSPLDLNAADSAALVMLPGIGPVFAARIIRYREQLGGFLDISQLTEINGLPDSLMKWFIIGDSIPLRPVAVNSASLSELRRHPYLNFYQSRAIVEYRRERGKIKGPDQLSFMEEFTARDLERLMPYLDFR